MSFPAVPVTFKRSYKDARLIYQQVETWEKTLGLFQHEGNMWKDIDWYIDIKGKHDQSKDFGRKGSAIQTSVCFAVPRSMHHQHKRAWKHHYWLMGPKNSYMQLRSARHVVFLNNMLDTWMQDEKCAPPMGYGLWHWACQNVFNLQIMTDQLNINQTTSGIQHQFKGFRDSGRVNPERDYS